MYNKNELFYFSNGINLIRRYYTIEKIYDVNNDKLNHKYTVGLYKYIKSKGISVCIDSFLGNEFLQSIGVIVDNKEVVPYKFCFPKDCDIDILEKELITKAKEYKHIIKPITAHIDIKTLNDKYISGKLTLDQKGERLIPLTEDIIKPKDISNTASFMIDILSGLYATEKTVIITDKHLFPHNINKKYKINLQAILSSLQANTIIHFGNRDKLNEEFFDNMKSYLSSYGTKLTHVDINDCHDRFWIVKENCYGLVFGTSLNGIGKQLCYYNPLEEDDIKMILEHLKIY